MLGLVIVQLAVLALGALCTFGVFLGEFSKRLDSWKAFLVTTIVFYVVINIVKGFVMHPDLMWQLLSK